MLQMTVSSTNSNHFYCSMTHFHNTHCVVSSATVKLLFRPSYDETLLQDTQLLTETHCLGIKSLTFPKQGCLSDASALMDEVILRCWSSLYTELNHNPIKWCREEQSSYSLGFTSQSLHPNPEEMGKWSFPVRFNGQPWASWFERTTKLWHTRAHFVQSFQDTETLTGPQCVL